MAKLLMRMVVVQTVEKNTLSMSLNVNQTEVYTFEQKRFMFALIQPMIDSVIATLHHFYSAVQFWQLF